MTRFVRAAALLLCALMTRQVLLPARSLAAEPAVAGGGRVMWFAGTVEGPAGLREAIGTPVLRAAAVEARPRGAGSLRLVSWNGSPIEQIETTTIDVTAKGRLAERSKQRLVGSLRSRPCSVSEATVAQSGFKVRLVCDEEGLTFDEEHTLAGSSYVVRVRYSDAASGRSAEWTSTLKEIPEAKHKALVEQAMPKPPETRSLLDLMSGAKRATTDAGVRSR